MLAEHRAFADGMSLAGQLAADTLRYISPFVIEGRTTNELDTIMDDYIQTKGGKSACRGYHGYPKATCISVNHIAAHGVPSEYRLRNGDLLNIDVTVNLNGYFGDTSKMFYVKNNIDEFDYNAAHIMSATEEALHAGIQALKPGGHVGDASFAISRAITRSGYNTTMLVGGHGIGQFFHGDPWIPFYGKKGRGAILQPYTCVTIEPILMDSPAELMEENIPGSTIKIYKANEGTLTSQLEHTILITDSGYEIMTL